MNRKIVFAVAASTLILAILACGPVPTPVTPTSPPTSRPTAVPTTPPTVAPTATTPPGGGGEEGGGKGASPTATPPAGGGEEGGGKGGGGSTNRPATVTLVNNSGETVCYVYISPTTSDTWGDDWLGSSETIATGNTRAFEVTAGTYDLRADDCDHNVLDDRRGVSIAGAFDWTIAGGGGGGQAGSVTVTLQNNSGQTVCYVYISPTTDSTWGSDWLGSDTVSTGSTYTFQVQPGTYDFKAEDCSHNVVDSQFGIALSSNWTWTIGRVSSGAATLRVTNNSSTAIYYLYISPSANSTWGDDQLGTSTIPAGGSYTFNVTEGTYDLKAEDQNHNVIATQFNFYISGNATWTVTGGGAGSATVTMVNNSGQTVCYVYISLSTDSTWGNDWLGSSETVASGASRTFSLPAGTYDLRADDCDHNILDSQYGITISGSWTWTIGATSGGGGGGGGGGGTTSITLRNNSSRSVCYVYISLTTSTTWGSDWLGNDTIPAGGTYTFYTAAGAYDLKAEDCNHNALSTLFNQNISGNYTWDVP